MYSFSCDFLDFLVSNNLNSFLFEFSFNLFDHWLVIIYKRLWLRNHNSRIYFLLKDIRPPLLKSKGEFYSCSSSAYDNDLRNLPLVFQLLLFNSNFRQQIVNWSGSQWMFPNAFSCFSTSSTRPYIQSEHIVRQCLTILQMDKVLVSFNTLNPLFNILSIAPFS